MLSVGHPPRPEDEAASGDPSILPAQREAAVIGIYLERLEQSGALGDVAAPDPDAIARYIEEPRCAERELLWAFDSRFYLDRYPDVAAARRNPMAHFVEHGWLEGRSPSPLIDMRYMAERRPDLTAGGNAVALEAFLCESRSGNLSAHPLFDVSYYLAQLDVPVASDALRHFLAGHGGAARPHRLFIPGFYLSQRPPVGPGESPFRQYLIDGWRMGFKPHPAFDPAYYLAMNTDVAAAGVEPLTHYVQFGQMEDRNPSAAFDSAGYRRLVGFEKTPTLSPLEHKLIYHN